MSSIGDLPLEILDLVAALISLQDIMTCLFVNHEWHDVFERVLYQSVDTRQRDMFLAFMQRLNGTARSSLPLGQCVRELKICDGFMTCKRMNQLLELCPYVNSLTFRWQDSKAHDAHITSTTAGPTRRYFGTPARIMEMFPRITQLTLECETRSRRNRTTLQRDEVSLYLNATLNVRSLTLSSVLRILTYKQMDKIHETCPNLMHLKISIGTSDYTSYIDILNTPQEVTGEGDERISNLDGPLWPAKAARLEHLEVCDESTLLDMERWIRYVAAMYPSLRVLRFSNWCWERSMNWSHESTPYNWRYADDKRLLAQRCPELRVVELCNVSLPTEAMHQIFSGDQLSKIAIKGECTDLMDEEGYKAMMGMVAGKVCRLGLALPFRYISEPFANNATMFDRLVELELVYSSLRGVKAHVRIDSVLRCCPVLKDLMLMEAHGKSGFTSQLTSGLTTLRLYRVDLRCGTLLRFVSRSCPQLSHLYMYQCITSQYRLGSRYTLDFPSHHLKSLCIYDHRIKQPTDTRVKLVSLSIHDDPILPDVYFLPDIPRPFLMMNFRSFEFNEDQFTDPNPAGKFIKLNTEQVIDLITDNRPIVSIGRKRKRTDSTEEDTLLKSCMSEMDMGGCISFRCSSAAKVIVNGIYLVRNGACVH